MKRLLKPESGASRRFLYVVHKQNLAFFWWNRLYCLLRECYGIWRRRPLDAAMQRRFALFAYMPNPYAFEAVYEEWKDDEWAKASRRRKLRKCRGLPI